MSVDVDRYQIVIRLPRDIGDRLKEHAARERRSINSAVTVILDEALPETEETSR